jgi:hypothetical protein
MREDQETMKRSVLIAILVAGIVAAAAGAAAVGIVSQKISIFTKSLTHASCTLPGTSVSDDVYTDENAATTNTGAATTTISLSPRTSPARRRYGFVRFDFTACSLPANAQVDSATLAVNVSTAMAGRTITVTAATGAWTEGALTWNTNPTVAGAATGTFSANAAGAKTVDVSADVADWVSGATTNNGWRLADLGATTNVTGAVDSSENATVASRPTLTVAYAS